MQIELANNRHGRKFPAVSMSAHRAVVVNVTSDAQRAGFLRHGTWPPLASIPVSQMPIAPFVFLLRVDGKYQPSVSHMF